MPAEVRPLESLATLPIWRRGRWYYLPTERLWLNPELLRVNKAPYSGAFTPYNAGLNGWVPMMQVVLAF